MVEYIEREAIWPALNAACVSYNRATAKAIEDIPAADVRPVVRGKWIWKDNGEVVCSECNDLIAVVGNVEDFEMVISGFNFCPNCAASCWRNTESRFKMSKLIDLTGRRFGKLTVIERAGTYISPGDLKKVPTWRCICDCGKESIVCGCNLRRGGTRSCGCLRKQNRRKKNATVLL